MVDLYITDTLGNNFYLDYTDSAFQVRDNSYSFVTSGFEPFWETYELVGSNIDGGTARTQLIALEYLLQKAREFVANPVNRDPVWLYHIADGEPVRRCLVLDGDIGMDSLRGRFPLVDASKKGVRARVSVFRMPIFERNTTDAFAGTEHILWGAVKYMAMDDGTFPGRIANLQLSVTGGSARNWMGIRPLYYGYSDFDPLIECEDGTPDVDTTAPGSVSGASNSDVMRCTFATSGMHRRFGVRIGDFIGAGEALHYKGRYLVMMRLKTSAADVEMSIQFRAGLKESPASGPASYPPVMSTIYHKGSSSWEMVELGQVQIPGGGDQHSKFPTGTLIRWQTFEIHAERLNVSGTCDFDAIHLVPAENLFYCEGGAQAYFAVGINPLEVPFGYIYHSTEYRTMPYSVNEGFSYPQGGAIGVIVASTLATQHVLTTQGSAYLQVYPRWRYFSES